MKSNIIDLPFTEPEFLSAWGEWILYRKQRHLANYTPIGLPKTFKKLYEYSNGDCKTAIAIIEKSIEKNWMGLFPLPNNKNGQSNSANQSAVADDKYKDAISKFTAGWQAG